VGEAADEFPPPRTGDQRGPVYWCTGRFFGEDLNQ
jgi:hypothetical protein